MVDRDLTKDLSALAGLVLLLCGCASAPAPPKAGKPAPVKPCPSGDRPCP